MTEEIIGFLLVCSLLLALLVAVGTLAFAACRRLVRRRRAKASLPADFWPRFEADLQAYSSRAWSAARERELRP